MVPQFTSPLTFRQKTAVNNQWRNVQGWLYVQPVDGLYMQWRKVFFFSSSEETFFAHIHVGYLHPYADKVICTLIWYIVLI